MAEARANTIKRVDKTIRALSVPRESHLSPPGSKAGRGSITGVKLTDDTDSDGSSDGWETDLESDEVSLLRDFFRVNEFLIFDGKTLPRGEQGPLLG